MIFNFSFPFSIGAKELPHIILLIEGRIIHYKGAQISSPKILDFIRRKFPYKLVESVHDNNVDLFLDGWTDNRVRVLLFGNTNVIKLRYLTTAFKFRSRAQVSHIIKSIIIFFFESSDYVINIFF